MATNTGRVRVKDRGWDQFKHDLRALRGTTITVGIHGDEPDRQDGESNVVIAGVHEFGSSDVPARPFVRPTFDRNRERYRKQLRGAVIAYTRKGMPLRQSLAMVAMGITRDVRNTIRRQGEPAGSFVPLSPWTLRRRKLRLRSNGGRPRNSKFRGHKALIDTGQMINSIAWVIRRNGVPVERGDVS